MCFSFVFRTGFVLKAVRKVRDTASQKLNREQKKNSPLTLHIFSFDLVRGCLSDTHWAEKQTKKLPAVQASNESTRM